MTAMKRKKLTPKTWSGWAVVYSRCGNVQMTLYTSKREAMHDPLERGDYCVRVTVRRLP